MASDDTIFALSSAPGRAGVAVLRISGPAAGAALHALARCRPPARRARLVRLEDPRSGEAIDRGLVLWLPGPGSFSGEDMAELHLHGGRAVVGAALEALAALAGLRPAEPGEFTRRAFEAGKLDLSEVEGLADLINAETEAQRRQALRQMEGGLSRLSEAWRGRLVATLARAEAGIDFPDEDLPAGLDAEVVHNILCLREEIAQYIDDDRRGERLRDGLYVAIIGPPNAGKSSLLNALARRPVAIVSETAGTTRDVIEVHLDLGGYPVTLADTAGLRALDGAGAEGGQAAVEAEGIRRARAGAAAADLKLAVFDLEAATAGAGSGAPRFDAATLGLVDGDTLVALNKSDRVARPAPVTVAGVPGIPISAKTGAGVAALLDRLEVEVAARLGAGGAAPALTRARHRRALQDCLAALERAAAAGAPGLLAPELLAPELLAPELLAPELLAPELLAPELLAEDLRLAARALGRIAGRVDVEDVLDAVFRDFCIGK